MNSKLKLLIIRYIEFAFNILSLTVYYASGAAFGTKSVNGFGEFVLILGIICSTCLLVLTYSKEQLIKKYYLFVFVYHIIMSILLLVAAICIITFWSDHAPVVINNEQSCGITVGTFCIFQCLVLIIGAYYVHVELPLTT